MFDNVMIIDRPNGKGAEWERRVCFSVKKKQREMIRYNKCGLCNGKVHTLVQSSQEQYQSKDM